MEQKKQLAVEWKTFYFKDIESLILLFAQQFFDLAISNKNVL